MNKLGRLSDVEMEVMQAIWGLATPVTVAQLLAVFQDSKGWKTSTIATILDRIIAKITNFVAALADDDMSQEDIAELREWFRRGENA